MTRSKQLFDVANLILLLTLTIFVIPKEAASEKIPKSAVKSVEVRDRGADKTDLIFGTRVGLDSLANFDNSVEFALSIQSLITSFDTPNGSNDYAAARYCIPASVDTPFTVVSASFFNNDSATVWPRILLTTPKRGGNDPLNLLNS